LRVLDCVFTPRASWFAGIADYATLDVCASSQLIRWDVEPAPPILAGSLKETTMIAKAAAKRQTLSDAARLMNTQ
jgi:hypothetical protein